MSRYELVEYFFQLAESKDIDSIMATLNEGAEFIDPHYPNAHMKGKEEIFEGLIWGFNSLKKLGFTIEKYFESEDGKNIAVEIATSHVLPNGKPLNFPQVFMIEIEKGKISKVKAYVPYGPHGILNILLGGTRLMMKIKQMISR